MLAPLPSIDDGLRLEYLFEAGPLAFFKCGDVRLMLSKPGSCEFDRPGSVVYFRVDDIHAARAELSDRGVPFDDDPDLIARMPDHELWMTFFRDCEAAAFRVFARPESALADSGLAPAN